MIVQKAKGYHIKEKYQKADNFTKPLDGPRFESLRKTIGVGTIL